MVELVKQMSCMKATPQGEKICVKSNRMIWIQASFLFSLLNVNVAKRFRSSIVESPQNTI